MMYPFMTLEDNTEVVHSEAFITEGKEKVKVYIEKPIDGGFQSAECNLPDYQWENIVGFNDADIDRFQEFLESTAHIIIRFAREGGFDNATNL